MLGAPGFGGDLIGCECIPGLSSTLAAGGGHALRASVPAGFAGATDSYVLGGGSSCAGLLLPLVGYAMGTLAGVCCCFLLLSFVAAAVLIVHPFRSGFTRLELVMCFELVCCIVLRLGVYVGCSPGELCSDCSASGHGSDAGVLPTMLMVEKPIEKVLSYRLPVHMMKNVAAGFLEAAAGTGKGPCYCC
ncbi:hypothetical protein Nepgr_013516 [Nepenthes gracilis]|uniref:Uncharacterized protein n=1 Tax=Nepenthes gracilis TaxID=150966 RepID=A0AAD3SHM3_NEPGR|nr:hypothetical protein Nepgr_013516 [Nepenthes gracilis]